MIVSELIKILQKLKPDLTIVMSQDSEGMANEIKNFKERICR